MQITGEIDWKEQGAVGAKALDQREEFGAVRSLTSKFSGDRKSTGDLYPERNMYQDMDISLPLHWESMTKKGHKHSKSSGSQEFEFSMSGLSADPSDPVVSDGISPADDLFYKGQLLPLHLPKRLQMVQKLSSSKQSDKGNSSPPVTVSCYFQPGSLKYTTPLGDEAYLSSALVNSRSSSFHSQSSNNFWESDSPNELDSGDSSSSRDSSGSSQDACNVPEKQTLTKLNDHIAFEKDGAFFQKRDFSNGHNLRSEKSLLSSWLRTPFKWKVFFGLKKPSKCPAADLKVEETRTDSSKVPLPSAKSPSSKPGGATVNVKSPRPRTYYSAEQKVGINRKEAPSDVEQGGFFSFPGAENGFSRGTTTEQDGAAANARESLHKYFNILKPSTAKPPARTGQAAGETRLRMVDVKARTSFSGNLTTSSPKQSSFSSGHTPPRATFTKTLSSPRSSFQEPRCRSPTSMPSFGGNLRVPSFSRSSKVSANAGNAVGRTASPHHSGLLNNSPSTMAELHSSIQGAIAHCKQSQSVATG